MFLSRRSVKIFMKFYHGSGIGFNKRQLLTFTQGIPQMEHMIETTGSSYFLQELQKFEKLEKK